MLSVCIQQPIFGGFDIGKETAFGPMAFRNGNTVLLHLIIGEPVINQRDLETTANPQKEMKRFEERLAVFCCGAVAFYQQIFGPCPDALDYGVVEIFQGQRAIHSISPDANIDMLRSGLANKPI